LGASNPVVVAKRDVGLAEHNSQEDNQAGAQIDRQSLKIRDRKLQPVVASINGGDLQIEVDFVEHRIILTELYDKP
jgi:hypothetical protein